MTLKSKLVLAVALSAACFAASATERYYMRVPAPAKCAGASCVMHASTAGAPAPGTPSPDTPKPPAPRGVLTAVTSTDFGLLAIGGNGASLQFTFKNTGLDPIANVYVTASGPGVAAATAPLRLTTCGVAGTRVATIQPGATCNASVRFDPTQRGAVTGVVNIVTSDSATPLASLPLTGVGGTATPVISADTSVGLDFGTIAVGSSVTRTFTYRNTGDAAYQLAGSGIWYDGAYPATFQSSRSCDNNVGTNTYVRPGEVCTVTITITPAVAGSTVSRYGDGLIPGGNVQIPLRYTAY